MCSVAARARHRRLEHALAVLVGLQEVVEIERPLAVLVEGVDHVAQRRIVHLDADLAHPRLELLHVDNAGAVGVEQVEGVAQLLLLVFRERLEGGGHLGGRLMRQPEDEGAHLALPLLGGRLLLARERPRLKPQPVPPREGRALLRRRLRIEHHRVAPLARRRAIRVHHQPHAGREPRRRQRRTAVTRDIPLNQPAVRRPLQLAHPNRLAQQRLEGDSQLRSRRDGALGEEDFLAHRLERLRHDRLPLVVGTQHRMCLFGH